MRPKLIEWLPWYGLGLYSDRYFKADKRDGKEGILAQWFALYHISVSCIIIYGLLHYIFKFN